MPRFARLFEAAADTLNAYYQAASNLKCNSFANRRCCINRV
ncbi:MAG: hypothetical protein GAK41_00378 [Burkholderia gladioli]|nr:MAG: hypothetical protein GAK41_00378 [Burkholderia gladioli]